MGIAPLLPGRIALHPILQGQGEGKSGRFILRNPASSLRGCDPHSPAEDGTSSGLLLETARAQEQPGHRLPFAPEVQLPLGRFFLF